MVDEIVEQIDLDLLERPIYRSKFFVNFQESRKKGTRNSLFILIHSIIRILAAGQNTIICGNFKVVCISEINYQPLLQNEEICFLF